MQNKTSQRPFPGNVIGDVYGNFLSSLRMILNLNQADISGSQTHVVHRYTLPMPPYVHIQQTSSHHFLYIFVTIKTFQIYLTSFFIYLTRGKWAGCRGQMIQNSQVFSVRCKFLESGDVIMGYSDNMVALACSGILHSENLE